LGPRKKGEGASKKGAPKEKGRSTNERPVLFLTKETEEYPRNLKK